ncbi:hypothetical protein ETH_00028000, partial [Eimeria tenella]
HNLTLERQRLRQTAASAACLPAAHQLLRRRGPPAFAAQTDACTAAAATAAAAAAAAARMSPSTGLFPEEAAATVYVRLRPLNWQQINKLALPASPAAAAAAAGPLGVSVPSEAAAAVAAALNKNCRVFSEDVCNTEIYVETVQPLVLQATEVRASAAWCLLRGAAAAGKATASTALWRPLV